MTDRYYEKALEELAKRLGWSEMDPRIRDELVAHDYDLIGHAHPHGGEEEWEDLKRVARKVARLLQYKAGQESPTGRATTEERPAWQLKNEEFERSWAFSEYISKIADTESDVRRFRSRYLVGQTVQPNQARALLTSAAAAIWPSAEFEWTEFSLLEHTCRVIEGGRDEKGSYLLVEAHDPSSGTKRRITDRRPLEAGVWSVLEQAKDALSNSGDAREVKNWKILPFPEGEQKVNRVYVKTGSVLDKLHKLVEKLIRRYPWQEAEAVWFVLTGETPWVAPVVLQARGIGSVGLFERQFVTIKAEPWVSEETIRRTYREAQVRMLRGDNHPAKDKQLRLFRFVSSRTDPFTLYGKERAKAAKGLISQWDRENPEDAYGPDTRRFWRDYDRARLLIAQPMKAAEQRERERGLRERRRRKQHEA